MDGPDLTAGPAVLTARIQQLRSDRVTLEPFGRLDASVKRTLTAEAERLEAFVG